MCGLTGLISKERNGFSKAQEEIMEYSMFLNQLRGSDSTGICGINNKFEFGVAKSLGGFGKLMATEGYKTLKASLWSQGLAYFGHGRAATVGAVDLANAHPHIAKKKDMTGEIIMVHNGTLPTWTQDIPGMTEHSSDSRWLAQCIADLGPKETFERVDGPMAVIWYDTDNQTINFFRNKERPLHFAMCKGDMYINSECAPLMYLKHKMYLDFDWKDIYEFKEGFHVSVPLNDFIGGIKKFEDLPYVEYIRKEPPKSQASFTGTAWEKWLMEIPNNSEEENGENYSRPITRRQQRRSVQQPSAFEARSLVEDGLKILSGEIEYVHFTNDGDMITGYHNIPDGARWTSRMRHDPYEMHLTRMERKAGQFIAITLEYANAGTRWERAYFPKVAELPKAPDPKVATLLSHYRKPKLVLGLKQKPGCALNFTTKNMGKKVKHKGQWHDRAAPMLTTYENDIDGCYTVGDNINFELLEVRPTGSTSIQVIVGILLKPSAASDFSQATYINVISYDHTRTKEEIEQQGFWSGKLMGIRVLDAETAAKYRVVVEFIVANLSQLGVEDTKAVIGGACS